MSNFLDASYQELKESGKYFFRTGESERADYVFRSLLERDDDFEIWFYLGLLENQKENYEQSLRHFYKSLQLNPEYGNACNEIGIILIRQGKESEAIDWFKQSINSKFNDAPHITFYNLSMLYQMWELFEDSLLYIKKAIQLKPNFQEAIKLKKSLENKLKDS